MYRAIALGYKPIDGKRVMVVELSKSFKTLQMNLKIKVVKHLVREGVGIIVSAVSRLVNNHIRYFDRQHALRLKYRLNRAAAP